MACSSKGYTNLWRRCDGRWCTLYRGVWKLWVTLFLRDDIAPYPLQGLARCSSPGIDACYFFPFFIPHFFCLYPHHLRRIITLLFIPILAFSVYAYMESGRCILRNFQHQLNCCLTLIHRREKTGLNFYFNPFLHPSTQKNSPS